MRVTHVWFEACRSLALAVSVMEETFIWFGGRYSNVTETGDRSGDRSICVLEVSRDVVSDNHNNHNHSLEQGVHRFRLDGVCVV